MAFFSVIIPSYNRASLLVETLASVQAQTFQDWECIVVDDGSTDGTREVVGATAKADPRIRYVYQANEERSVARNNGIAYATGRYICFLDSDDRYMPTYLERLEGFLAARQFPIALVACGFYIWNGTTSTVASFPPMEGNVAVWLYAYPVSPSRACVHRDITAQFRFREDIIMGEDTVLWISISTKYPILLLNEPLVLYRVHEGNSVNRNTTASFRRHDDLKRFFSDPMSASVPKATKRDVLSDVRFRMAEYHALNGQRFKAVQTVLWSILTSPVHRHTKAKLYFLLHQFPGFARLWESK